MYITVDIIIIKLISNPFSGFFQGITTGRTTLATVTLTQIISYYQKWPFFLNCNYVQYIMCFISSVALWLQCGTISLHCFSSVSVQQCISSHKYKGQTLTTEMVALFNLLVGVGRSFLLSIHLDLSGHGILLKSEWQ